VKTREDREGEDGNKVQESEGRKTARYEKGKRKNFERLKETGGKEVEAEGQKRT